MRVIARKMLREFWTSHPDAEGPLKTWFHEAEKAHWKNPVEVKARYVSASFLGRDRVVFNTGGNKYRLVVAVRYRFGLVFIRFIGTHAAYDRIDAETV